MVYDTGIPLLLGEFRRECTCLLPFVYCIGGYSGSLWNPLVNQVDYLRATARAADPH